MDEAKVISELAQSCREYIENCQQGSVELTDRLIRACEILGIELDLFTLTALLMLGTKKDKHEMDLQNKMLVLGYTVRAILDKKDGEDGEEDATRGDS